ncbi:MAG: metal ABC transporter permease [Anaerolineales bacterium]
MEALLTDPLAFPYMVRGLLAAILIGVVAPVLGCYVVLRGMAFFGDAVAHIVLPGVVVAVLLGWPVLAGALVVGILGALLINFISTTTTIKEDSAIGVVFVGAFSLGIALLSVLGGDSEEELDSILFGNLLDVSQTDLLVIALLTTIVLVVIVAFFKEFLVLAFDRILASTMQLPVGRLDNLLLVLLAVVIVISLSAVGVVLILAMLITPAASAYLLTRRLPSMMLVAAVIGVASGVAGLYLSFHLGVASGPMIVLAATTIFGVIFIFAPGRGYIASRRRGSVG